MTTDQSNEREQLERSLIDMAVESWRFARLFGRLVSKLDAGEGLFHYYQDPKLSQKLDERKRGTAPRSVRLRLSAGRYVSRDGGRVT